MHLQAEDFELYALGRLPKQRVAAVDTHISRCEDCKSRLKDALRLAARIPDERRLHPRTPTDEPGWMQVMVPPRLGAWEVRIVDVSPEGMSLRTEQHVSRGWKIKVRRGDMIVFGEVRYCVPAGKTFRVGIQIREVL